MADIRTKRRRVRNIRPEVLRAIHDELLTGASAPQVVDAMTDLQAAGKLPKGAIPSERTVSNIAREMRPSPESAKWELRDANPETVNLVLLVLSEVVRRTEGTITSLTKAEAALLPTVHRTLSPRWTKLPSDQARAWQAYVWTRFYLSWVRSEQDASDAALLLAFMQTEGKWNVFAWSRAWPRAERVLNAATGWLPPELLEVPQ